MTSAMIADPATTLHGAAAGRCACGVAFRGRGAHAYNEEAFHYFLAIEREHERRGHGPFGLCLVEFDGDGAERSRVDPVLAARLFQTLWRALRETDVVGWYREGRVIGAVLTDLGDDTRPEVLRLVAHRVEAALRERLPSRMGRRLRLSLRLNASTEPVGPVAGS